MPTWLSCSEALATLCASVGRAACLPESTTASLNKHVEFYMKETMKSTAFRESACQSEVTLKMSISDEIFRGFSRRTTQCRRPSKFKDAVDNVALIKTLIYSERVAYQPIWKLMIEGWQVIF